MGLQEIGPRFTLKLRSVQKGTFDTKFGEFEFVHNVCVSTPRGALVVGFISQRLLRWCGVVLACDGVLGCSQRGFPNVFGSP